ncbi:MAG: hypothetical protein IPL97_10505 [Niastella sp.]|nr:hypothetical protein [Niastella sp.]
MSRKKYFILFSVLILVLYTLSKFICFNKDASPKVSFYTRNYTGGYDRDTTYYPELKISNYRDGEYSVNELFQLAKSYLDTLHNKSKIGGVVLYGEAPCKKMPTPNSWTIDEFKLVYFDIVKGIDSIELTNIAYWKNGKLKVLWKILKEDKKSIDSIISVKTKFRRD